MSETVEYFQEVIFLHFCFRSCGKLGVSIIFLVVPLVLRHTDAAFFPGFPRETVTDRQDSPPVASSYVFCFLCFLCQDFLEWIIVTFGFHLSGAERRAKRIEQFRQVVTR